MIDVIVRKTNEAFARIVCEPHVAREMSEYFTFFVPGYKFMPRYRSKTWDGKIRLMNYGNGQLPMGLVPYVKIFCKKNEYTLEIKDGIEDTDEVSLEYAKRFTDSLKLCVDGKSVFAEDHQLDAFIHSLNYKRALMLSPTSSGKSMIIYLLFRYLLEKQNLKGLLLVPRVSLVHQMYTDFIDYSTFNKFDVKGNVHKVHEGTNKKSDKKLIISTWQSIYKLPKKYFEQFDYIIGDEAHEFKSNSLTKILNNCGNAKYRIGLTGTLDGTQTHKLMLVGLFGLVKKVTTTKELMDKKKVAKLDIKCLVLKHNENAREALSEAPYRTEINYLIGSEARNKFIKNLVIGLNKNTLILFQLVEKHGKVLYNIIKESPDIGNRKVFFIHGGIDVDVREEIRRIVETETDAIILASYGTFAMGVSIKKIFNVVFASPYKGRIKVLQSIGRGLRLGVGKDSVDLYDISDDLRSDEYINHTLRHFFFRVKTYTDEKFDYKIYKIGLKDG